MDQRDVETGKGDEQWADSSAWGVVSPMQYAFAQMTSSETLPRHDAADVLPNKPTSALLSGVLVQKPIPPIIPDDIIVKGLKDLSGSVHHIHHNYCLKPLSLSRLASSRRYFRDSRARRQEAYSHRETMVSFFSTLDNGEAIYISFCLVRRRHGTRKEHIHRLSCRRPRNCHCKSVAHPDTVLVTILSLLELHLLCYRSSTQDESTIPETVRTDVQPRLASAVVQALEGRHGQYEKRERIRKGFSIPNDQSQLVVFVIR
ncbi:hypothetical protein M747DRAFT_289879 [Aspergillus niger ATCC 13496]|uniref:Uncharacterized protein n=3 Tax=Aspergillus niger TaxID=5061 RepID=A2QVR2_ASPNC|nr:hypothetical protein An11g02350 [Aspergillus niger]RDH14828.1 hypothetical protein M747DRAFT_289879 [Aspergillus niger ATCC 13496]CAK40594.1 hypothetical protein An11g02350 [Aspergillus niger]